MDIVIEELVEEIKTTPEYQEFIEKEKKLEKHETKELLKQYQEAIAKYQEVRQYASYIATDEQLNTLKEIKKVISEHQDIQQYYSSYHEINRLLDEVTSIVFANISETLSTTRYRL